MPYQRLVKDCLIFNDYEAVEYASKIAWFAIKNRNLVRQATFNWANFVNKTICLQKQTKNHVWF